VHSATVLVLVGMLAVVLVLLCLVVVVRCSVVLVLLLRHGEKDGDQQLINQQHYGELMYCWRVAPCACLAVLADVAGAARWG